MTFRDVLEFIVITAFVLGVCSLAPMAAAVLR